MANKITYGISNVYYAVATIAANGSATYTTPVALPGAVSITLDPEGGSEPFYADNSVYYTSVSNNGYTGTLELADITEAFETNILGDVASGNYQVETDSAAPVHFALIFQFEGDDNAVRHCIYNCVATRPTLESSTKEDTVAPNTRTLNITATTIYNATLTKNLVKVKTTDNTTTQEYNDFVTTVFQP